MRSAKEINNRIRRCEKAIEMGRVSPMSEVYALFMDEINELQISLVKGEGYVRASYNDLKGKYSDIPSVYIENDLDRNRLILYRWLLKGK